MDYKYLVEKIINNELKHLRNRCPIDITDQLFCIIEKNYMGNNNFLCSKSNSDQINKSIGKWIRKYWNLKNLGICDNPNSSLIKFYTEHSN